MFAGNPPPLPEPASLPTPDEFLNAVAERLDQYEVNQEAEAKAVYDLTGLVKDLTAANQTLRAQLTEALAAIVEFTANFDRAVTSANNEAVSNLERFDAIEATINSRLLAINARFEDTGTAADERFATIDALAAVQLAAVDAGELSARVDLMSTEFGQAIARAEEQFGELSEQVAERAVDTDRKVSSLVSKLPRSLLIDHAGDLIAIDNCGDKSVIGPVRGSAGRDAPVIEAAAWKHGHIVLTMTDRTSHLIELPAPPVPEPPKRTPAGDKIKDAIRMGVLMDRNVDTVAAIGKRYGISSRVVRDIIKDHAIASASAQ